MIIFSPVGNQPWVFSFLLDGVQRSSAKLLSMQFLMAGASPQWALLLLVALWVR